MMSTLSEDYRSTFLRLIDDEQLNLVGLKLSASSVIKSYSYNTYIRKLILVSHVSKNVRCSQCYRCKKGITVGEIFNLEFFDKVYFE